MPTITRPLRLLLTRKGTDATVTLTHSRTADIAREVRRADIVVAAVGVPHLVRVDWIKLAPQSRMSESRASAPPTRGRRASLGTSIQPSSRSLDGYPHSGGVGPMTRAVLVPKVVPTAERRARPNGRLS